MLDPQAHESDDIAWIFKTAFSGVLSTVLVHRLMDVNVTNWNFLHFFPQSTFYCAGPQAHGCQQCRLEFLHFCLRSTFSMLDYRLRYIIEYKVLVLAIDSC